MGSGAIIDEFAAAARQGFGAISRAATDRMVKTTDIKQSGTMTAKK
jgi:hypothetical protein